MARDQNGFSIVEGLVTLAAVIVVAGVAWIIFQREHHGTAYTKTAANTAQTAPKQTASSLSTGTKAAKSAQPASSAPQVTATQSCIAPSLQLSAEDPQETAGTIYMVIRFTNISSKGCTVNGFPLATVVDSQGNDLGKPADTNGASPGPVTVAPGQSVAATISVPNPGFLSPGQCTASAPYIQVSLPGDPRYLQTAFNEAYCPGLSVTALQPSS
jgi:Tfp pilus assembly protein PilV